MPATSRIPGFHRLTPEDRLAKVVEMTGLDAADREALAGHFDLPVDALIENALGSTRIPLGIATNFIVNGRDVLVPMAVEEASVIAAASNAAKMARPHGGFEAKADAPQMIAQVQIVDIDGDPHAAAKAVAAQSAEWLRLAREASPAMHARGGGLVTVEARALETSAGPMVIVHLIADVRDAMGANAVNHLAEALAPAIGKAAGGRPLLRILSNLADRRLVRVGAIFDKDRLGGDAVVADILLAWAFADADPYRAATHNKGLMNGVDAVVIATGNDWRSVEAGAHAYAARDGHYRSLTRFRRTPEGHIEGELVMPLALGIVGGATKTNPVARASLKILGVKTAGELAEITAAVGLAQNLAAVRALVKDGIQAGHMRLHARSLALEAGVPADRVDDVIDRVLEGGTAITMTSVKAAWDTIRPA